MCMPMCVNLAIKSSCWVQCVFWGFLTESYRTCRKRWNINKTGNQTGCIYVERYKIFIIVMFSQMQLDKCLSAVYELYVAAVDTSLFSALRKQYHC